MRVDPSIIRYKNYFTLKVKSNVESSHVTSFLLGSLVMPHVAGGSCQETLPPNSPGNLMAAGPTNGHIVGHKHV